MDDANKQPHSLGSGQQRNPNPRPFFYVQPPSQPYYLYQPWQLNNPYSHYGLPGGFNFARPCMHPFQYMQYPGFVFPHAPVYPMDYRRMFEPRFAGPTWGEIPRQQQPHGRREMACSEAQTDPSDAITKLIECLDKIRASEMQGASRELDSGIASQSSGMFSPGEEKKNQEQDHVLSSAPHDTHAEVLVDSPAENYNGEASQMILGTLSPHGSWSGGLEEELPLDSSSVQEDCPELEHSEADEHLVLLEEEEVQSDTSSVPKCDAEELQKSPALLKETNSSDKVSTAEHLEESVDEAKPDRSYQILKLPFDCVLTPGAARLASTAAPYYFNYPSMQATHERMSVLSPSLDELSSRDEMFSTDLDDVDLFPKQAYTPRRLVEVIGESPQASEDVDEAWMQGLKRVACACCGKSLAKGTSRRKVHGPKMYLDEGGDSEDDYGRGCEQEVVVRKHRSPRKNRPLQPRHAAKPWFKRGLWKETSDQVEDQDVHKQEVTQGETGESELQCGTCEEKIRPHQIKAGGPTVTLFPGGDQQHLCSGKVKPRSSDD
nr:PREDICTED: uncharacterized protein LOC103369063 [Stegastes partitus]